MLKEDIQRLAERIVAWLKQPRIRLVYVLAGAALIGGAGALLWSYQTSQVEAHPPPGYLIAAFKEIHDSKILFNPSSQMEQGKVERIEARVSYKDVGEAISKGLIGTGDPKVETIKVGRQMSVTLNGDSFDIKKYSSETQWLLS